VPNNPSSLTAIPVVGQTLNTVGLQVTSI
jgi:hypothetical protein